MSTLPPTDHTASLVFYFFNQLSQYPRQSRKEDAVRDFVIRWADAHSYHTVVDRIGNCTITVPADDEKRQAPTLALQAHFDMVCESTPGHIHDFAQDPIIPQYENDWVSAHNTTLGADNGIGIALAMALCDDPLIVHPQLELVFTVDEETGLTGAAQLDKNSISAKYLLNLDSEDGQVLINGCAGGLNLYIRKPYTKESQKKISSSAPVAGYLEVSGFSGGHSGVDIHKPIGNPVCCMALILESLLAELADQCYVGSISGGTVHNAIPRDCAVELMFTDIASRDRAEQIAIVASKQYAASHGIDSTNIVCTLSPTEDSFTVRTRETSEELVSLLAALPHGVHSFTDNPNIPQTSSNIAHIERKPDADYILLSLRSSDPDELKQFADTLSLLIKKHSAKYEYSGSYPAWHPRANSKLLSLCKKAYQDATGTPPRVEVIHAGLETAVIANIVPHLDMLSCGPLILNPHSPQERVSISSTADVYRMLVALLRDW